MPYIEAAGARLHVEEHGDGYPIIFVHELGSDLRQWEDQVRYFSRAYRCIAYNARGYPPSDVPEDPTAYGWEHSVDDIAAVMHGLGIDRSHVVGLSMGAYAALQFGLRYPQRVSAIVAAAAGSGSSPSGRHAARDVDPGARVRRARSSNDRRKNRDQRGPHPTQIQGSKALAGIYQAAPPSVRAGTVEHSHPLPGPTTILARSA